MSTGRRGAVTAFVCGLAALVISAPAARADGPPIGPHQHFVGVVNGQLTSVTVHTVCAGPASPGRLGPIAGGQTFAVRRDPSGGGYTGLVSQVYAWFVPNASTNGHLAVKLTAYRTRRAIPAGVRVPCDGSGRVEFSSCPYLAPCAAGWVPTYVWVRFVNIAV